MTLIEFNEVSKKFGSKLLIDKVSFKIKIGEITTLIGPNGAGKTTIAKLILGLEKPSSGLVKFDHKMHKIAYVPQALNISSSMPMTAGEFLTTLTSGKWACRVYSAQRSDSDKTWYSKLLDFANFERIKQQSITSLSEGQFQKLLITTSFLQNPNLIVMDEPTQSLDIMSQQEFYRLLETAKNELGVTIFMISHDLFTVMKNSDQVICLNSHICCSGRPGDDALSADFLHGLSSLGFYTHHHDHKH